MAAEYMHIGIPITTKKPGMVYNDKMKMWMSNPQDYEFKIEYLKFEEGTPFPEILHKNPHVAYRVDDMDKYLKEADRIVFGPVDSSSGTARLAYIVKDDAIIELYQENRERVD